MPAVTDLAAITALLAQYQAASALEAVLAPLVDGDPNTDDAYFIFDAGLGNFVTPAGPPYASGFKLIYTAPDGSAPQEFLFSIYAAWYAASTAKAEFLVELQGFGVNPDA